MKTLHLPLKKEWYRMIESGVKTEEYREIKPYWKKRLVDYKTLKTYYDWILLRNVMLGKWTDTCQRFTKGYTHVKFSYGYTKRTMTFEIESITIGKGYLKWGAPTENVFIIKLGKRSE